MIKATFSNWISRSNSNGGHWVTPGERVVYVDVIPPDAPQDWSMGPKMVPGQYGAFLANGWHPRGHSPYAFEVGKTEAEARDKVSGFFEGRKGVKPEWEPVND